MWCYKICLISFSLPYTFVSEAFEFHDDVSEETQTILIWDLPY